MNPPRRPSRSKLDSIVRTFNRLYPVGTPVILRRDRGEVTTRVKHPAQLLEAHTAVAWFDGLAGCHSIENDRVRLVSLETSCREFRIRIGNQFLTSLPASHELLDLTPNDVIAFRFRDSGQAYRLVDEINANWVGNNRAIVEPWPTTASLQSTQA